MSYTEFSVTYIHNKFGGLNTIKVPAQRVILDDRGHTTDHLFKTENQKYYFEIFGHEYMVGGEVLIPGEWNYCCVNGKFFHLEKTKSAGFIDDQESFYYTLIYDDGQNDGLTNNVNLCGTINLTGDRELVKEHLVQTTPLLSNVNNYRYLNGKRYLGEDVRIILPIDNSKGVKSSGLSSTDFITINNELKKLNLGEPNRDKLIIPLLYRTTPKYQWKGLIVKAIKDLERKELGIYDVDQTNELRPTLQVKFNTNELYTITTTDNRALNYAKTLNKTKYIEEIDLSGFTDLVQLHPTTLTPEYTSVESQPKFSLRGLCEKIRSRFNGPRQLIPYMEDIATNVFAEGLGDLINTEVDRTKKKIFKNVTVTPISRNVNGYDYDTSLLVRNPDGLNKLDSLIPNHKFYRNFIFSKDELKEDDLFMFIGTHDLVKEFNAQDKNGFNLGLTGDGNSEAPFTNGLDRYLKRQRVPATSRYLITRLGLTQDSTGHSKPINLLPFRTIKLCQTKGIQLVIPTYKYKLVEVGDEESSELDFTRTDGFEDTTLLLVPDYERKTHVLSIRCPVSETLNRDRGGFFFDHQDDSNPLKGQPIYPYVTTELFEIDETTIGDSLTRPNLLSEWRKNLSNNPSDSINPVASLYHFLTGTYKIKYKTYYSTCGLRGYEADIMNGCGAYPDNARPDGYRQGGSEGQFIIPGENGDGNQYGIEMTLPYSTDLMKFLDNYKSGPDELIKGKVINNTQEKGINLLNPLIYTNEGVRRMTDHELTNYGSEDIVAIWINPTPYALNGPAVLKEGGLITNEKFNQLQNYYTRGSTAIKALNQQPFILASTLVNRFYQDEYGPLLSKNKQQDNLVIPLRIYHIGNMTREFGGHQKNPIVATGIIKPYEGFNYLCGYRFMPFFSKYIFGFSSTRTEFKFKDDNYFVMVIPDTYANSGNPVPTYSYREPISQLTRESNIAFLVNGSGYDATDSKRLWVTGGTLSNNLGSSGWSDGDLINARMKQGVNQSDLFFEEFIKKQHKSNRTNNPNILHNEYYYELNGRQIFNISTLDDEIPPFMVKYLDPDRTISHLHTWKTSNANNDNDRLKEFKEKLLHTITRLKTSLVTDNTGFQLQGTDGYISVKLNIEDTTTGDFELFTTKPRLIKSRTTDTGKFENYKEDDIDVLINTSNEITLYGKRITQKSRYISETDDLDLRLKITPLEDPKQTVTASGYKVEMKTEDQDLIRDIIEIPKEQVRAVELSVFQREQLFRDIELKAAERNSEAQLFEISRDRFKQKDSFEYAENMRRMSYRMLNATADMGFGMVKAGMFNVFDPTVNVAGMEQAVKGGINLIDAAVESGNLEADRVARFTFGLREFDIKGARMQQQHLTNRANDMQRLSQMSSRIQYPQMNSGLIYRQFNKSEGLNDVYITQYYPSGKLLKYIKEYYKEYGYEILVRDHVCIGIDSIKRHLRYTNVFRNEYTNQRIRAMIEARALNGIFVSDTEVFG